MNTTETTPQEIGLDLAKLLVLGKQPCKHSDALWETVLKLLNMKWEIGVISTPILPYDNSCFVCGKNHGGLQCPNLTAQ
jgi:hypothetical protein